MTKGQSNPLTKYFRQPAIFLRLPSRGRWWEPGSLDMPDSGELPVYPMSARDEIILKTPDALLNGQGVVDAIHSCVPGIKNAWKMPSVDVDAVLIAMRIATYGNNMDFESDCPNCKERSTYQIDLSTPLSEIQPGNYSAAIEHRGLYIRLKPQCYFEVNRNNMIAYEEQRILNALSDESLDPKQRSTELNESMKRLVEFGVESCVASTESIVIDTQESVTDPEFIAEFYRNAEAEAVKKLQNRINELVQDAKPKPVSLMCKSCNTSYTSELSFDYANFFGKGF